MPFIVGGLDRIPRARVDEQPARLHSARVLSLRRPDEQTIVIASPVSNACLPCLPDQAQQRLIYRLRNSEGQYPRKFRAPGGWSLGESVLRSPALPTSRPAEMRNVIVLQDITHCASIDETRRGRRMRAPNKRLKRERETIERMIALFCREQHRSRGNLCAECAELAEYAQHRLDKCPFEDEKPTCARCPIHCYKPARREQIRLVMRYAGPRLLFHHPVLAIRHKLDARKKPPDHPPPGRRAAVDAQRPNGTSGG